MPGTAGVVCCRAGALAAEAPLVKSAGVSRIARIKRAGHRREAREICPGMFCSFRHLEIAPPIYTQPLFSSSQHKPLWKVLQRKNTQEHVRNKKRTVSSQFRPIG